VDQADGIYFSHAPNKKDYAEGEPLDISGAVITLKYKRSGDLRIVTDSCTFYPPSGEIMTPYGTSLHAYYQMPGGNQYEAETLLNVQTMTVPIDVIGQIIGEDLGLDFNADLPSDFWDGFYPQDVPYIPADGDYYVTTDIYSSIVDYLSGKGAFSEYQTGDGGQYGDIPFMKLPAGSYVSADGQYSIEATADIYIIAAMEKKNGLPETLPSPSCVDYPYTNAYAYNQIQVLTFTLNASDYIRCDPGLRGGYNSATSGICRKMAGLGLPYVEDETMYTDYITFPSDSIVNIPGILALPWCWYDEGSGYLEKYRAAWNGFKRMRGHHPYRESPISHLLEGLTLRGSEGAVPGTVHKQRHLRRYDLCPCQSIKGGGQFGDQDNELQADQA